jgi:hypothetical protein
MVGDERLKSPHYFLVALCICALVRVLSVVLLVNLVHLTVRFVPLVILVETKKAFCVFVLKRQEHTE